MGRQWSTMQRMARMQNGILEKTLAALDEVAARRGRAQARPAHLLIGIKGEEAAVFYLRREGYTVVARRWVSGNLPGDLDLIAWKGSLLCIVEVKTRTAHDLAPAETAIDAHKRKVLRRLARQYVRLLNRETLPQVRFDVVSVYLLPGQDREIVHFENAFGWSERRS
jgi:putative endonuclease